MKHTNISKYHNITDVTQKCHLVTSLSFLGGYATDWPIDWPSCYRCLIMTNQVRAKTLPQSFCVFVNKSIKSHRSQLSPAQTLDEQLLCNLCKHQL